MWKRQFSLGGSSLEAQLAAEALQEDSLVQRCRAVFGELQVRNLRAPYNLPCATFLLVLKDSTFVIACACSNRRLPAMVPTVRWASSWMTHSMLSTAINLSCAERAVCQG